MPQNAGFETNQLETNETNPQVQIMTSQCSPPPPANDDAIRYLTTLVLAAAVQNVTLKLCII